MGESRAVDEVLHARAADIVAEWRAACTAEALAHGASAVDEGEALAADRARALVTASGTLVVGALTDLLPSSSRLREFSDGGSSLHRAAEVLIENDLGVGTLVRQLSLLRQVIHRHAQMRLPAEVVAQAENQLNLALDTLMEACAARAVERLEDDAFVDPLTGLLNRRALERDLAREMAVAERRGRPLSLLTADVDGLKKINDGQGHGMGDETLRAVAGAMRAALRGGDAAYRVGGDEFLVLLPEMSADAVAGFVTRVRAAASPAFSWGAATFPDEVSNSASLLELSDRRLLDYRKATGTGRVAERSPAGTNQPGTAAKPVAPRRSRGSLMAAAFFGGVLLGGGGLASAATGTLPGPMQEVAHTVLARVGVPVPEGRPRDVTTRRRAEPVDRFASDANGAPCTFTDGRAFNGTHGRYVSAHPNDPDTPENERELAARSRCGTPAVPAGPMQDEEAPGRPADPGKGEDAGPPADAGSRPDAGRREDPGQPAKVERRPPAPAKPGAPVRPVDPAPQERPPEPAPRPPSPEPVAEEPASGPGRSPQRGKTQTVPVPTTAVAESGGTGAGADRPSMDDRGTERANPAKD